MNLYSWRFGTDREAPGVYRMQRREESNRSPIEFWSKLLGNKMHVPTAAGGVIVRLECHCYTFQENGTLKYIDSYSAEKPVKEIKTINPPKLMPSTTDLFEEEPDF